MRATALRLGVTRLSDVAPIAVAVDQGLFARHGLRVELAREPSWANVRDKLAAGALDAAQMLAPMTLAATLGVGPVQQPTLTALSLGLGGNAITLSTRLWNAVEALDPRCVGEPARVARALARLLAGRPPLRLGSVFPVSMHAYELRWWLAAGGLVPDRDVRILVVPPSRMVEALESGAIDGFCVGEPWNSVAVQRGSGVVAATKHELWNHAPEKVLGVRLDWAEREPEQHKALLRALLEAGRWCDEPENRIRLPRLLAGTRLVAVSEAALAPSLLGRFRKALDAPALDMPYFHSFHRFGASFPWRSHAVWMLCQMLRWGQIEKPIDLRAVAAEVYRADLYREVAAELGLSCPLADEKVEGEHPAPGRAPGLPGPVELGPDLTFDGTRFDARDALGWLAGLDIHERRVSLDELAAAQRSRD